VNSGATDEQEAARLEALHAYGILDTPREAGFDRLTELVCLALDTPAAILTLVDEHRQWFKSRAGVEIAETDRDLAFCSHTILGPTPFVVEDALLDPRFANNPLVTGPPRIRAYAGTPLVTPDGHALGALAALDWQPRQPTPRDLLILQRLGELAMDHLGLWKAGRRFGRRLSAVTDNAFDVISLVDEAGTIVYVNPSVERVIGFRPEELIGRSAIEGVHPDDVPVASAALGALMKQPGAVDSVRYRWRHKDGSWRTMIGIGQNLLDEPDVRAIVAHSRDATAEVSALAELLRARRLESVARLTGGLAHDFNNLLTTILAAADYVRGHTGNVEAVAEGVADIITAARRAGALTQRMLAFGRQQVLARDSLDLAALIAELMPLLTRALPPNVDIAFSVAPALPPAYADRSQIEQIVLNLVLNACDAMPHGGTIRLELSSTDLDAERVAKSTEARPGRYVSLSVQDAGEGMSAETLEHVFEPFFTTKELGTGLGLAVVHGVVAQHGGLVTVSSTQGSGTLFEVYLPVADSEPAPSSAPVPVDEVADGLILFADDLPEVRSAARRSLKSAGFELLMATDGEEALRTFEQHKDEIDIAVLDVVMPRMTGVEAVRAMRRIRPDLPFLLVSGYRGSIRDDELSDEERRMWLAKPFEPAVLVRRIREAIAEARAKRRARK
jgi:PAS domain S-box-containing protein